MELVITVAVVAVLASLAYPSFNGIRKRAQKAKCIGNMRVIHSALDGYVLEKNTWPQMPEMAFNWEEEDYFKWWIDLLDDYGAGPDSWLCPADKVFEINPKGLKGHNSSYIPALFNNHQYTPFRWNQPWLVERGDFHGKGAHVMMQDGSIATSQSPWGER
ncbi:MAG: hypothetical protein KDM64_13760 [Verrucomicrobiae bacterium]|nr:hypothetical protein [Verrucomicrobiae bacterium]